MLRVDSLLRLDFVPPVREMDKASLMFTPEDIEQTFMIEGQILSHSGPLLFFRSKELAPENVVGNGSFGLVDTGKKKLLVTCHHVVTEFLKLREEGKAEQMAVLLGCNHPVPIESGVVDSDSTLDLATLDMEPLLTHFARRIFFPLHKFPVPTLNQNELIAFCGYVKEGRIIQPEVASFRYESFGLSVADVSRFHITADLVRTRRRMSFAGTAAPRRESLGGISGSPCFSPTRSRGLRLVSFVTSDALGLVRMTHAGCIKQDGTLDRREN
ncbi:MAG TPA: hypothetical protein VKA81_03810 [Verrucomicrobiae bacterium]|nr:hypothetical protein [Verrucomicrobiae bacterium]